MKKIYLFGLSLATLASAYGQSMSENFDSFSVGDYMGVESANFTTWSGATGGAEDVQVTDAEAYSGSNAIYFSTVASGGGPQDILIPFGGVYNTGTLVFESMFYVEDNKGAYFNFQGTATAGEMWSMNVQMVNDGRLLMDDGASPMIETTYPSETWFNLSVNVNLNTNVWELFIDGVSQGTYAATNNVAASANIYPVNNASGGNNQAGYYLDDISYEHTPYTLPERNAGVTLISNTNGLATAEVTPSVTVRNLGTSTITSFDIEVAYNGTTIEENVTGVSIASLETYVVDMTDVLELAPGENAMVATVSNVNGIATDDDASDDEKTILLDPVVPADGKVVLGEEATGTWCGWCPRGAVFLERMAHDYPDHFIGVAVHNGDPMADETYDAGLGGLISGYPSMVVDRGNDIDPSAVEGDFLDRVVIAPKAVLTVGSDYTDGATSMNVSVTAEFNEAISGDYRLALIVVEDGVTGTGSGYNQNNSYSGGGAGEMGGYEDLPNPVPAADMVYDHVGRAILPGFGGASGSFPDGASAGESHTVGFTVDIDAEWDLSEVHLVGILVDPSGDIDNAGQATMDEAVNNGYLSIQEGVMVSDLVNLYPNPTSTGSTNIDLGTVENENVTVQVFDMKGQLVTERNYGVLNGTYVLPVELSNFEKGMYSVRIFKGSNMEVTKLVVE